jgi:hypothetical protein
MLDVSVANAKKRTAQYGSSWDPDFGDAGVFNTKRDPNVLMSDHASRLFERCVALVPPQRQDEYRAAALRHLSGCVGYAAVKVAVARAAKGFIAPDEMRAYDLVERREIEPYSVRHPTKA